VGWLPRSVEMVVTPRDRMRVCVSASVALENEAIADGLVDLGEFCGMRCRLLAVTLPDQWVRKELECRWSVRSRGPSRIVYCLRQ